MKREPLMTTSTGSFPRPSWLAETKRSRVQFHHEGEARREAQDDATIVSLHEQDELGLDLLTDGEQRREDFIYHATVTWDGVDLETKGHKDVYRGLPSPHEVPRIVGKIARRAPACAEDARFAKAHMTKPLKMAVPGPMTVVDSTVNEFYSDVADLAMDAAAAINAELLDLQAAGSDMLQIDEPAMTRYHDQVFRYGAAALDRCLEGVTVPTIVHLCYGYPGGAKQQHHHTYPELLASLMKTRISGFTVEFGRSDYDPAVLKGCEDRLILFGCIDPGDTPAPSVESVKHRVAQALKHLDPKQILLAPDCGLMTISRALARQKIRVMVEAARALRETL